MVIGIIRIYAAADRSTLKAFIKTESISVKEIDCLMIEGAYHIRNTARSIANNTNQNINWLTNDFTKYFII